MSNPHAMPDAPSSPFSLGDGPDACLLLHGFTGAPSEVRPLAERLARDGMRVVAPLLPGHGVSSAELRKVTRHDLLDAAARALAGLSGARNLFLGGLSAGAMLSIELAALSATSASAPKIRALALLAPAVRFLGSTWLYTEAVGRVPLGARLPIFLNKGARDISGNGVGDLSTELRVDGSLARVPLNWGRELRLLSREGFAQAPRVRAPAIILQGGRDRTAAPSGARRLAAQLGSEQIELRTFPESGHVLPLDHDGPAVCDAVGRFFARAAAESLE